MTEDVLFRFYQRLNNSSNVKYLDLPHSDVCYIKVALREKTGVDYSLEHVKIALILEGLLPATEFVSWPTDYLDRFYNGKRPNLEEEIEKSKRFYGTSDKSSN